MSSFCAESGSSNESNWWGERAMLRKSAPSSRTGHCLIGVCLSWIIRNFSRVRQQLLFLPLSLKRRLLVELVDEGILADVHLKYLIDGRMSSLNFDCNDGITDEGLFYISKTCPRLESLSLRRCPRVTHKGLSSVFSNCPLVKHLDVAESDGVLDHKATKSIQLHCRSLNTLVLDRCLSLQEKDFMKVIGSMGGFLRELSLNGCVSCNDRWLSQVAQRCGQLESIHLEDLSSVTVTGISEVARKCRSLQSLNLASTFLSAQDLRMIIFSSHDLRKLDLSFVHGVDNSVITQIANNCPSLQHLRILGVQGWSGMALRHILQNCASTLHTLLLDNCKDISNDALISMKAIANGGLSLLDQISNQITTIAETNNAGNAGGGAGGEEQRAFPENHPKFVRRFHSAESTACALRNVSLCGQRYLQDDGLEAFFSLCPNIKSINLSGMPLITDQAIRNMSERLQGVTEVDISLCQELTGKSLEYIGERFGSTLTVLRLYGNRNMESEALAQLAAHCRKLEYISMYGCSQMEDEGVISLVKRNPNLQMIDLSVCNITDNSLFVIAENCRYLQTLRVNTCRKITTAGVSAVAQGCPHLNYLNCNNINATDALLGKISRHCQFLRTLSLASNENISDAGFLLCARGLPRLKKLIMSCSSDVSGSAIKIARRDRPTLQLLFV